MKKQQLRKIYLQKRMDLSPADYELLNTKLLEGFRQIDFTGVHCISIFLPMLERREPDTFLLIDWLKQTYPAIKLSYPKTNFSAMSMEHYMDDLQLEIDSNDYGIPEPIAGNKVYVLDIDMVIVPLLVFDKQGYRVGYGKGFYDRFMPQCKAGTQFIGLSFFEPVEAILDLDEYDIALHQCITPQQKWLFN